MTRRNVPGVPVALVFGFTVMACAPGSDVGLSTSLDEPPVGSATVLIEDELFSFDDVRCTLEPYTIDPDDIPPGGHVAPPEEPFDVYLSVNGDTTGADGEDISFSVTSIEFGGSPSEVANIWVFPAASDAELRSWSSQGGVDGQPLYEIQDDNVIVRGLFERTQDYGRGEEYLGEIRVHCGNDIA